MSTSLIASFAALVGFAALLPAVAPRRADIGSRRERTGGRRGMPHHHPRSVA